MATGQKSSGFWRRPVAAALKRGRRGRSQKGQAAGAIQSSSGPLPTVARQRHNTNGLLVFGTCHVSTALCVSVLRCVCACAAGVVRFFVFYCGLNGGRVGALKSSRWVASLALFWRRSHAVLVRVAPFCCRWRAALSIQVSLASRMNEWNETRFLCESRKDKVFFVCAALPSPPSNRFAAPTNNRRFLFLLWHGKEWDFVFHWMAQREGFLPTPLESSCSCCFKNGSWIRGLLTVFFISDWFLDILSKIDHFCWKKNHKALPRFCRVRLHNLRSIL